VYTFLFCCKIHSNKNDHYNVLFNIIMDYTHPCRFKDTIIISISYIVACSIIFGISWSINYNIMHREITPCELWNKINNSCTYKCGLLLREDACIHVYGIFRNTLISVSDFWFTILYGSFIYSVVPCLISGIIIIIGYFECYSMIKKNTVEIV
jgi:hypothetical protein